MAAAKMKEAAQLQLQPPPSSPEHGFLPYPNQLHAYQYLSSDCKISSLYHPGLASEFPLDTLISAINAFLGCNYIQAREQLFSLLRSNVVNPEMQLRVNGEDLIMAFESLDRCIVANERLLQVQKQFSWKRDDLQQYQLRQYHLLYELLKLGIMGCIVISINEKANVRR